MGHAPWNRTLLIESLEGRTLLASPLVITSGGTYSGTWISTDRTVAAVTVKTSEPVIIEDSTVIGSGDLIESGVDHTNITVRNVQGYGVNPNVYGKAVGEFIDVERFNNLVVENSYMENTGGINMLSYLGGRTPGETVRIVGNRALNIDGRKSDGNGGYLNFNERTRKSDGRTEEGYEIVQFVQFDKVIGVPGIVVAWNEVINEPGMSRVEDNINIYKSSGTASSPILIHDNYVQGAYTVQPWLSNSSDATYNYDWSFSGGGILLGDGVGATPDQSPAFVKAYGNTVISTTNYGIAIAAGHDMEFYDNRIFSAGVTSDGRVITQQNVGAYVWDSYGAGSTHFYNNLAHDNLAGWVKADGKRNDYWTNAPATMVNNVKWNGAVTLATEAAERDLWRARFAARNGAPPTVTPSPIPPPITVPITVPVDGPNNPTAPVEPIELPPPTAQPSLPPIDEQVDPIEFSGVVYDDRNGDGIRQKRDGGVAGRSVYADLDNNNRHDADEPFGVTDAKGQYTLSLPGGKVYTVRQVIPDGWYETRSSDAAIASGSGAMHADFGVAKYATISGKVFADTRTIRTRDATTSRTGSESGLGGFIIYIDANNNGWRDPNERAVTSDADGNWKLDNVKPGVLYIRIHPRDRSFARTTGSYYKHAVLSGSNFANDDFGYAPRDA